MTDATKLEKMMTNVICFLLKFNSPFMVSGKNVPIAIACCSLIFLNVKFGDN